MRLAVPAFFGLNQDWASLEAAGGNVRIVVPEQSFPVLAAGDPQARQAAQDQFQRLRNNGTLVLGYVFSRSGPGATDALLTAADIVGGRPGQGPIGTDIPGVDQWYAQFPTQIDGIYFDNAVLWPDAGGAVTYPIGPGGAAWTAQMFWSDLGRVSKVIAIR